jgi:hypothetical protein
VENKKNSHDPALKWRLGTAHRREQMGANKIDDSASSLNHVLVSWSVLSSCSRSTSATVPDPMDPGTRGSDMTVGLGTALGR